MMITSGSRSGASSTACAPSRDADEDHVLRRPQQERESAPHRAAVVGDQHSDAVRLALHLGLHRLRARRA